MIYSVNDGSVARVIARIVNGINVRIEREESVATVDTLVSMRNDFIKRKSLSLMSIAYIDKVDIDFAEAFTSRANNVRGNAMMNVKAIDKLNAIASALNGGTLPYVGKNTNDSATTAFVILAIANGIVDNSDIQTYMALGMCTLGKGEDPGKWHSQNTQTSSSTRALAMFDVIEHSHARGWKIKNAQRFARLVDAARGITCDDADYYNIDTDAVTLALTDDGIFIDAEYYDVPSDTVRECLTIAESKAREKGTVGTSLAVIASASAAKASAAKTGSANKASARKRKASAGKRA